MRNEYPRPQKRRDSFISLNKEWFFEFDDKNIGHKEKWFIKHNFSKKILVPFAYQAPLSGIGDPSFHDHIWYDLPFEAPSLKKDERLILNFLGVDYFSEVYVNGYMLKTHYGAAGSFYVDITDYLNEKDNHITLYVYDPSEDITIPRGKQDWEKDSHGIWYTRTSGIYKPVFMEVVNKVHLENFFLVTDIDKGKIYIDCELSEKAAEIKFLITNSKQKFEFVHTLKKKKETVELSLPNAFIKEHLWSDTSPKLLDLVIEVTNNKKVVDKVYSYFGLRKVDTKNGKIYLNDKYLYQKLVLNQGYNEKGILTYPSAKEMEQDILYMKEMGFNGCRIHQKVEDQYFLYLCDKLGFIIWQEQGSAYTYNSLNARRMLNEWIDIVKDNYNHPSIIAYTPLNESWGVEGIPNDEKIQAHALSLYYMIKSLDNTRLVISNDGWEHCTTDLLTIHNYDHGAKEEKEKQARFKDLLSTREKILRKENINRYILLPGYEDKGQPILLTEFGGVAYRVKGHNGKDWGYTTSANEEEFIADLKRIYKAVEESKTIEGICYTQFTDVEQEINGLMTYDRQFKINPKIIKDLNDSLGGK